MFVVTRGNRMAGSLGSWHISLQQCSARATPGPALWPKARGAWWMTSALRLWDISKSWGWPLDLRVSFFVCLRPWKLKGSDLSTACTACTSGCYRKLSAHVDPCLRPKHHEDDAAAVQGRTPIYDSHVAMKNPSWDWGSGHFLHWHARSATASISPIAQKTWHRCRHFHLQFLSACDCFATNFVQTSWRCQVQCQRFGMKGSLAAWGLIDWPFILWSFPFASWLGSAVSTCFYWCQEWAMNSRTLRDRRCGTFLGKGMEVHKEREDYQVARRELQHGKGRKEHQTQCRWLAKFLWSLKAVAILVFSRGQECVAKCEKVFKAWKAMSPSSFAGVVSNRKWSMVWKCIWTGRLLGGLLAEAQTSFILWSKALFCVPKKLLSRREKETSCTWNPFACSYHSTCEDI